MLDVLGKAISDYFQKPSRYVLWIHNTYGPKERMPVEIYFRMEKEMPALEITALQQCRGKILDIGAGAGSHALWLQQKKKDVTALEISESAGRIMQLRGVKKMLHDDIFLYHGAKYDTLLLLMNGIGLTGTIERFRQFLEHAKKLLKPGGQLLFDSSDVAYLYNGTLPKKKQPYYGEILYEYEYKKERSGWFKWLYIDQNLLKKIAASEGWLTEILYEDEHDQYLAKLTLKDSQGIPG